MSQKSIYGVSGAKIPIISFLKVKFQSKKAQKGLRVYQLPVIRPILYQQLVNFGQKTLMGLGRQLIYFGCICWERKKTNSMQ